MICGATISTNDNSYPSIQCLTDLVNCCNNPRSRLGQWYYPNGSEVKRLSGTTYYRNRGANGPFGPCGAMVFGVVRLFRRGIPPERGRFRCEIPTIANPNNEMLHVNICELNYDQT